MFSFELAKAVHDGQITEAWVTTSYRIVIGRKPYILGPDPRVVKVLVEALHDHRAVPLECIACLLSTLILELHERVQIVQEDESVGVHKERVTGYEPTAVIARFAALCQH